MKSLEYQFELLGQTRHNFCSLLHHLSLEQINKIPAGYSNNIVWNFGHALVTQQQMCYLLSHQQPLIDSELINRYRKGSKPTYFVEQEEVDMIENLMDTTLAQLIKDYESGIFQEFESYTTSFHTNIYDIEEAIQMNVLHEALHFGYALSIKNNL